MKAWQRLRLSGVVALVGLLILSPDPGKIGPACAQMYRWVDEQGGVHVTDNPNDVPPRFRSQAPPAAPALTSRASAAPPDAEVEARDRELREQGNRVGNYLEMPSGRVLQGTPTRGRSFEDWRGDLRSASPQTRSNAAETLRYFGSQAVPALVQALKDPSADVRLSALVALVSIGPGARPAGPDLARLLGDPEPNVRVSAAFAVLRMGSNVKQAIRALRAGMPKRMWKTTEQMFMTLVIPPPAVPALVEVLGDQDPQVRAWAARALFYVRRTDFPNVRDPWSGLAPGGPPLSAEAVDALVHALKDPEVEVQKASATSLSLIGPDAVSAVPALAEAFKDQQGGARADVLTALVRLAGVRDSVDAISFLRLGLKDLDPEVQVHAAGLVTQMHAGRTTGPAWLRLTDQMAKELVLTLLEAAGSPDARVRRGMLDTVGALFVKGQPSPEVTALLIQALKDPSLDVQKAAASSLSRIGPAAVVAMPALVEASRSPRPDLRAAALKALVTIAPDSREVTLLLIEALTDPDRAIRSEAVMQLRRIGPSARDAVQPLKELAQREPERQAEVAVTIQVIQRSR